MNDPKKKNKRSIVSVPLSREQLEVVEKCAERLGMSLSGYIREAALLGIRERHNDCRCPEGWPQQKTWPLLTVNRRHGGEYVTLGHTGECPLFDEMLRTYTYREPHGVAS